MTVMPWQSFGNAGPGVKEGCRRHKLTRFSILAKAGGLEPGDPSPRLGKGV